MLLDFPEKRPDAAVRAVEAEFARGGPAADVQAGDEFHVLVQSQDDIEDADFSGRAGQAVAAAHAPYAFQQGGIAQLEEDALQEALGDMAVAGNGAHRDGIIPAPLSCEDTQGHDGVAGLAGEHRLFFAAAEPLAGAGLACDPDDVAALEFIVGAGVSVESANSSRFVHTFYKITLKQNSGPPRRSKDQ